MNAENKREWKGIWIPKNVWLSRDLTLQEKCFLIEIDSLDNEKGCFASNQYFASFFQLSKGRVSQVVKGLIDKDYIKVRYIRAEGQQSIIGRVIRLKMRIADIKTEAAKELTNSQNDDVKLFRKLNTPIKETKEVYLGNDTPPIKNTKEGCLGNDEVNNTVINNTVINNTDLVLNESEKNASIPSESDLEVDLFLEKDIKETLNTVNVKQGDLSSLFFDGNKVVTNDIKVPKNESKAAKKAIEPTLSELAEIANEKLAKGTYPTKELAMTFEKTWNGLFNDDDLKFPFDGKEMAQLKLLAKKINKAVCDRQNCKTITVEFLISSFQLFLDKTIETADQFTLDNFTPSLLNSKYGAILTKIRKGGGNGTTAKNGKVKTTFHAANIAAAMERIEAKAKAMGM